MVPAAARGEEGGIIDHTGPFWPVYDRGLADPLPRRAADLARAAFTPNPEVRDLGASAAAIERWLPAFDPLAGQARALRSRFAPLWQANIERFAGTLPGFRRNNQARLLFSRFGFVAALDRIREEYDVVVGLDEVVRRNRTSDLDLSIILAEQSLHAHQFHYNWRILDHRGAAMWRVLWFTGLALYCAQRMFPQASPAQILGEARLADASGPDLSRAAAQMLALIDSGATEEIDRHMGDQGLGRAVALWMLQRQGRARTLHDMVFLPARPARDIVLFELQALSG